MIPSKIFYINLKILMPTVIQKRKDLFLMHSDTFCNTLSVPIVACSFLILLMRIEIFNAHSGKNFRFDFTNFDHLKCM